MMRIPPMINCFVLTNRRYHYMRCVVCKDLSNRHNGQRIDSICFLDYRKRFYNDLSSVREISSRLGFSRFMIPCKKDEANILLLLPLKLKISFSTSFAKENLLK